MAISTNSEQAILALIFNGTAWAGWAQNQTTTPNTTTGVSLNTADPLTGGTMNTSEATYTGYLRVQVSRVGTAGWNAPTGGGPATVNPAASITFANCTGGTSTVTNFTVGGIAAAPATTPYLWSGTVTPNISVSNGVTPSLTNATAITLT